MQVFSGWQRKIESALSTEWCNANSRARASSSSAAAAAKEHCTHTHTVDAGHMQIGAHRLLFQIVVNVDEAIKKRGSEWEGWWCTNEFIARQMKCQAVAVCVWAVAAAALPYSCAADKQEGADVPSRWQQNRTEQKTTAAMSLNRTCK